MSAVFSLDRRYRYRLDRELGGSGPTYVFCLHNPSTASEDQDDPTSRRGVGFARRWGGSRMIFVNAWAAVATNTADLWRMSDPVGPDCDKYIFMVAREAAKTGGFAVAAWGRIKPPRRQHYAAMRRLADVAVILRSGGCEVRALGTNADGSPKHPLYIRADAEPQLWF
jgi:hypothetical protein